MSDYITADDELVAKLRELEEAKANRDQWNGIAGIKRDEVIDILEEAGVKKARSTTGLEIATISEQTQQRFDKEALQRDYPDIDLSLYTKPVFVKQLRTKNL